MANPVILAKVKHAGHFHYWPALQKKTCPWRSFCGLTRFHSDLITDVANWPICQRCAMAPRGRRMLNGKDTSR